MRPKRAIKELERQLRKDSENLVLRLKLAAAYREGGRLEDAVALYRSVAVAYHGQGRLVQAVAVCRSVLEIDPTQRETQALLEELNRMRAAQAASEAAQRPAEDNGAGTEEEPDEVMPVEDSIPSLSMSARRRRPSAGAMGREESSSGMRMPLQDPEAPPMGSLPPSKQPVVPAAARPGVRRHPTATERMSKPPMPSDRPSAGRITPTPLPQPLALHDADNAFTPPPRRPGPRPLPKNLPNAGADDEEEPTRIAPEVLAGAAPSSLSPRLAQPDQVDDDAMTTIAGDSGMLPKIAAPPPELPAPPPPRPKPAARARRPSTRPPLPAPPDDAPRRRPATRPPLPAPRDDASDEIPSVRPKPKRSRRPAPRPAPRPKPQPSFFEQETRLVASMDDHAVLMTDDEDEELDVPTNPGVDEDALTPPPSPASEAPFVEEPTNPRLARVAAASDSEPTNRATQRDLRPPPPLEVESPDELSLEQAFDRSFAGTIKSLDPDGSAIDTPLTLFSDLPDEALVELSNRMVIRSFAAGELIIREGEPGDACFVVAMGEVRVLKRNPIEPHGDLVEVARLGQGALFGEFALLADRRRHATVQAVGKCELYEIPRRLLRELAASFPEVGPLLENFYRERLLATLLHTAPFFKPLPEERRAKLLSRFKPMRAESGERIIEEGEKAGGLYLIVLGSVEIIKRVSDKRMVLLATLGEGAYFGEMSLLKGGVANASVVATGPTELAVMAPRDFYDIVADNPVLWDEVRREANRRQLEMNQIVTGETNVV